MPNEQARPGEYDAILGGQNSTPLDAAVLGGIAGVNSRLASPTLEVRIAALSEALKYGDAGLDLIMGALQDKSVELKLAAYSLLKDRNDEKVKQYLQNFPHIFEFEAIAVDRYGKESSRLKSFAFCFTEDLGNSIVLEMVYIPGGKLMRDSPVTEGDRYRVYKEGEKSQVIIPAFFASKYPITQAQWEAVMGKRINESSFTGEKLPVENVPRRWALKFIKKLSEKTGKKYRFLSQAEWEYACRAGTTASFDDHFFMKTIIEFNSKGNHPDLDAPQGLHRQIKDVGSFGPNAFGLYDMHGKVAEWCGINLRDTDQGPPTGGILPLIVRMHLESINQTDSDRHDRILYLCHSPYWEGIGSSLIEGFRVAMSSYSSPS
jgi:formylglycine-generating enzyme required for sulfatase activity